MTAAGMGDIVNLRTARKQAKRLEAEQKAAANRLAHGRSKAERALEQSRSGPAESRPAPDRNGRRAMKSKVVKRSIVIAGHKTSVSLEEAFWRALKAIAADRRMTMSDLVGAIDSGRQHGNLSSAIRLFVLEHYQARLNSDGQVRRKPPDLAIGQRRAASILRAE
jgi:predicted DNA-binding ribbon-helix-helix protein